MTLLDRFLDHHKSESADATYQFYKNALDSFAHFIGPRLRLSDLKPDHVYDWIKRDHRTAKKAKKAGTVDTGKPTSDNYRRNLIRAVKAAFRWSERREQIERSPVRYVELPTARAPVTCTWSPNSMTSWSPWSPSPVTGAVYLI